MNACAMPPPNSWSHVVLHHLLTWFLSVVVVVDVVDAAAVAKERE